MSTQTYTAQLNILACATCRMDFGILPEFMRDRRRDHRNFYCPQGHVNHYPGESDTEQFRRQRDSARARATHLSDQLESEKRSKAAIKGHLTRIKRRIANGVCPCCQRNFKNVRDHMASQHPDFLRDLIEREEKVEADDG